jgi:hypothetical protein
MAAAHLRAGATKVAPAQAARELYGKGNGLFETRAATSPATTGVAAWAGAVAPNLVSGLVQAIASLSAGAGLMAEGLKVDLSGIASLRLPARPSDAALLGASCWVAEGSPAPVPVLPSSSGPTLRPHKLLVLSVYTRELAESSSIEEFVRTTLSEATAAAIDKKMFSADAETTAAPAGLLASVTTVPPAAAGSDFPMSRDIGALVAALSLHGGGLSPVLICAPPQYAALHLWTSEAARFYPVFASRALAAGTVIAIEASSFVSSTGAEIEFETAVGAAIHTDDSAPAADLLAGTPVRSLYQTDLIGLKMRLPATWGLRNAAQVAICTGVNW